MKNYVVLNAILLAIIFLSAAVNYRHKANVLEAQLRKFKNKTEEANHHEHLKWLKILHADGGALVIANSAIVNSEFWICDVAKFAQEAGYKRTVLIDCVLYQSDGARDMYALGVGVNAEITP